MTIWRKVLGFINVILANRSPTIVAVRGSRRVTYATRKTLCSTRPARVTRRAGKNRKPRSVMNRKKVRQELEKKNMAIFFKFRSIS